jgi:hypothetical protein
VRMSLLVTNHSRQTRRSRGNPSVSIPLQD